MLNRLILCALMLTPMLTIATATCSKPLECVDEHLTPNTGQGDFIYTDPRYDWQCEINRYGTADRTDDILYVRVFARLEVGTTAPAGVYTWDTRASVSMSGPNGVEYKSEPQAGNYQAREAGIIADPLAEIEHAFQAPDFGDYYLSLTIVGEARGTASASGASDDERVLVQKPDTGDVWLCNEARATSV